MPLGADWDEHQVGQLLVVPGSLQVTAVPAALQA